MLLPRTQVAGVTVVADAKDFGFKQLRNLTIDGLCCGASIVQDSFPLWFRDIHVVNAARFFYLVSLWIHYLFISFVLFKYLGLQYGETLFERTS